MKVDSLPYEFELLTEVKLYGGDIYRIISITDIYGKRIKTKIDGDKLTFTIVESMVISSLVRLFINYEVNGKKSVLGERQLDIYVDFVMPIYFDCLPFERVIMFNNII